jgi:hypothetical protein
VTTPDKPTMALMVIMVGPDDEIKIGGLFSTPERAQAAADACPFALKYLILRAVPVDEPLFTTAIGEIRHDPTPLDPPTGANNPIPYCPERYPGHTSRCVLSTDHQYRDEPDHRDAFGHTWQ